MEKGDKGREKVKKKKGSDLLIEHEGGKEER